MSIAALFITVKHWEEPNCPSSNRGDELWYTDIRLLQCKAAEQIVLHTATHDSHKYGIKRYQGQKNMYCLIPMIRNSTFPIIIRTTYYVRIQDSGCLWGEGKKYHAFKEA